MSAKEFDVWWNEQGELQASFCGGSIPTFARTVWDAAIGSVEQNSDSPASPMQQLKAEIAEIAQDLLNPQVGWCKEDIVAFGERLRQLSTV